MNTTLLWKKAGSGESLKTNEEYFVALLISGISLAVPNMAWAFGIGILIDLFIRKARIRI
jgi:sulfate permease, SulP family